ncbi:hypothetical protein L1O03_08460 [Corynebacterium uropygiale]|uniref:DUF6779 domain-containing protein n=1 Tax=Corynebacterium uropygiale TaxID=1775911 RepID=A0A9X1U0V6_9CORY|nr:DUF6779 domain-containing protein [Corynebacterium uropygiale]MCF4007204.1 hypothetical protein [Corynebacterium uropygiale]
MIVLALVASVIMLVTNSSGALKLALLAALWAAIIGFFLVTRYRRQADESRRELEYARDLYHAEMECAEAEMEVEQERFAREYAEKQRDQHADTLERIHEQLGALRGQLEDIAGQTFEYEPAALRAEARRVLEIEQEARVPDPEPQDGHRAPSADAVAGRIGQQPSHPIRYPWAQGEPAEDGHNPRDQRTDEDAAPSRAEGPRSEQPAQPRTSTRPTKPEEPEDAETEEAEEQGSRRPSGHGSAAGAAGAGSAQTSQSGPSADETATIHFDTGSFSAVSWDNKEHRGAHERPEAPSTERRGRRRADDKRAGSFTVAELLARAREIQEEE